MSTTIHGLAAVTCLTPPSVAAATERTRVRIPLRFGDGYAVTADAVTFHGHIDDVAKHHVLQSAWVHVLPSRKEGWGLAVLEAAQHRVPTIGYRSSGGLSDSIVDGVTGILVDSPITSPQPVNLI